MTVHEKGLAVRDEFYFIADLPGKALTLKYHGAFLTSWPIQKVEVVASKIFFFKRSSSTFPGIFYILDAAIQPPIDLPRPKIIPANPEEESKDGSPSAILPTMEELIKAPQDFTFTGDSPVRLVVHMPVAPKNGMPQPKFSESFKKRLQDFWRGLKGDIPPTIILTLKNEDGEEIYRAFPEKVNVLVYLTLSVPEETKK